MSNQSIKLHAQNILQYMYICQKLCTGPKMETSKEVSGLRTYNISMHNAKYCPKLWCN